MNNGKNKKFTDLNFLIITHTFATGPTQELRDFFIKNKIRFSFLEHPFSYNKIQPCSKILFFIGGEEIKCFKGIEIKGPEVFYFIKDFFYTLYFVIKTKEKYDICISADNLNSFSAYFLKKLGYIDKLIYWTIDYTPRRFKNSILNKIYHWIDKFCCYHSDLIWSSSERMKEARRKNGANIKRCAEEVIVGDGCHFDEIKRVPDEQVDRFRLVFMGHLVRGKGIDLIIDSMPYLLQKYPQATLTIIGTGPEEKNLKNLVDKLNIQNEVIFTGFVKEHKDLEKIITSCGIALAPYLPDPNSYTFFSDVGKVKIYLACGLPVLLTDVPEIAKEIEKNGAGLIFNYERKDFIKKLQCLLEREDVYFQYRNKAIQMASELSWDVIFNKAMQETIVNLFKKENYGE